MFEYLSTYNKSFHDHFPIFSSLFYKRSPLSMSMSSSTPYMDLQSTTLYRYRTILFSMEIALIYLNARAAANSHFSPIEFALRSEQGMCYMLAIKGIVRI